MQRTATAHWEGDLRSGNGSMRLGSGAFEGPFSFKTRFEGAPGTNPEELLGAAHAGCFSMALSHGLAQAGKPPTSVDTKAVVTLEGVTITKIELATRAVVPGLSAAEFQTFAEDAKANCIVSKALAAVPITLQATLVAG
jgi:osmotically inducible protein OsmC